MSCDQPKGIAVHNRSTQRRNSAKGFSLVELLVVLGLIALLLAMLLPAITKAQRRARSTVCQANLRQCGLFLLMYCNDNKGCMFPVGLGSNVPRAKRWPVYVFTPPAWNPRIMTCPDDLMPVEEHSYILNQHLSYKGIRYGRSTQVPTETIIVMGEKVSIQEDYYLEIANGSSEFYRIVELYRHGIELGSNYLYLDLHVDSVVPSQNQNAMDPWDIPIPAGVAAKEE